MLYSFMRRYFGYNGQHWTHVCKIIQSWLKITTLHSKDYFKSLYIGWIMSKYAVITVEVTNIAIWESSPFLPASYH